MYKHYISSYIYADALHAVYFVLGHLSVFISHCLTSRVFVFPTFPRFPSDSEIAEQRDVEKGGGAKGGYLQRDCYQCWLNGRHTQGTHTHREIEREGEQMCCKVAEKIIERKFGFGAN